MTKYFKFIKTNKTNKGFQYKLGLNVDTIPFNNNDSEECVKGGLYFSEAKDLMYHFSYYYEWLAEVELPDDEPVITFKNKSRVHQLIVKKFYELSDVKTWKYLVEQGANIHAKNDEALRNAARNDHLKVVKYLVEKGADIHAEEDSALRYAAEKGHLKVVKYLVEQGANIHVVNEYALRYAAANGHLEVVKYLVKLGADIHARDDWALRYAEGQGHLEVVKYLKSIK